VLCAPALFDPAVPPPGQWAVANALPRGEIVPLTAGHFANPYGNREQRRLREVLRRRFG
jgi:cephalosporin-C deacetylase